MPRRMRNTAAQRQPRSIMPLEPRRPRFRPMAPVLLVVLVSAPAAARAKITTSIYSYNVDGALTAVTTQVNQDTPATRYLTWDDFTPDAATPSTGTVNRR